MKVLRTEEWDHVVRFFLLDFFGLQLAVVNVDLQKIVSEKNTTTVHIHEISCSRC